MSDNDSGLRKGSDHVLLQDHKQGDTQLKKGDKITISPKKVDWFRKNKIIQ